MAKRGTPAGGISPAMRIVVLHGKEPYLIASASKRYEDLLREEFGNVARIEFDGQTAELAAVLDELRSFALFDPHKLVIVDAADKFLAEQPRDEDDGKKTAKSRQSPRRRALEAYAGNPVAQASLLLRAETWRPGKLDKIVAGIGAVIKFEPLREAAAVKWCVQTCPQHGATIEESAAALLVERVGTGLARLNSELAKLVTYAGSRTIGRDDVGELVGHSRQEQAWDLQSAIMSGSAAAACTKLRELLEISRLDEALVTWAITDLLRRIHTASQLLGRGEPEQSFRHSLRLHFPPGDRMLQVARRVQPSQVARLFDETMRTVHRTRSGLGDSVRNLEVLTVRVTDSIKCF